MTRTRIALLAGIVAGIAGCRLHTDKPDGSGTIECTQVQVAPQVAGRIAELPPAEGALLRAGDLVARIDGKDYELRRAEAQAALAVAQAQLDLLLAGTREEDVRRGREQVREAQAAAQAAAADLQRIEQVFAKKSATQKQLDDARSLAERTAAARAAAEANADRLLRGSRQEELRVAQAQVEQARARVALTEKAVADCLVTAPLNGTVTTRIHEPGEVVAAGTPLLTLSRLDEVWLSIYVPETQLARVKLGQPAHVRIDGDAGMYTGAVTFVASEAEFTPRNVQTQDERTKLVYRVKITLANPRGVFKPGMPADGFLVEGQP